MDIPVQYYDEPGGTAGVEEGEIFNHRRPLLFDGSTLYVGGFGQYHEEAMAAHDLDRPGAGDIPCGAWFPHGYEDRTKPHVKKEPGHIAWFSNMIKPEYRAQIAKQLGGHDVDLSTEWSFHPEAHPVASNALRVSTQGDTLPEPSQGLRTPQNASVHQLDWVPGATGKGYVDVDGAVRTWNTDGNGRPHHAEVQMGVPYENEAAFPNAYALGRMRSWPFTIGADGQFSWAWDQKRRDKPPVHPSDVDPRLESLFEDDMPGEWRFGSHTHRRVHGPPETYANDWTPGNYGKAIAYTNPDTGERELWHWSVGTGEDGDTADLYPHHIDYQNLTSTNPGTRKEYGILPNGIAAPVWSNAWDDGDHELFDAIGAQPGAQSHDYDPWQNDQWHFAVIENGDAQQEPDAMNGARPTQPAGFTAYETPPGLQPWVEGGPGKGLLLRDGKRYAWATDRWGDGYPHHLKAIQAIGIPEARQYLDDHPVRAYMTHYQNGWADWPSLGDDFHLWSDGSNKADNSEWKFGNRDFSLLNHLVNNPYVEGDGVNYHTWTPGYRGKGMILPDGRPATWNIENTEPATYAGPHHRQVAEYLGVGSYPQVSDEAAEEDRQIDIENGFEPEPVTPGWHTPIYINPDGTYGTLDRVWNSDRWHTDNGHPAFDQLGLTREHEDNGWTFGKVAWKWNHPWEVQIHEDATGSIEPDFVTEGSRPILYDNNNKIVHIGPMHRYHADLYRHLGVPHIPDVHQGRAFATDFTIGTYDRTAPEALQAAANALNENDGHTRWMPSSNDVPEHWAFGKVTPKGKVIPFPDDSYAVQGTYDGDRIPFLYGHDSGNFYLGRPGDYHYQVQGEHNPPEATAHGMLYSNATHDWYTRPVNEPDLTDVINTVRAHPSYEGFFRKDAPLPEQQGHEWTFSKTASLPEVVPVDSTNGDSHGDEFGHPYIYVPSNNKLYVGSNDSQHWDLIQNVSELQKHYDLADRFNRPPAAENTNHQYGRIYRDPPSIMHFGPDVDNIHSQITQAVNDYTGHEHHSDSDAMWSFSKTAKTCEWCGTGMARTFDARRGLEFTCNNCGGKTPLAPRRASRSEGQTWLDVVDGTVDRSWPSHADAVTDTSDKRDEETDDKATHKADSDTFTPSKLTPHDAPLSPIPTHLSYTPLVPPTADHDSGAYESGQVRPLTSSLALFLASLTPSDEEDDLDPSPIDSEAYTASVSLTSSTPITLINAEGEVGHTDGHRPADMYQVGGARDIAAQPGPGHSDSNAQQGDDADNRPSHKRMVRVQSIREDADCLDQENRKSYHNDPESQWNLQGGSGADTLYGHDLLSMPEAQGGCSLQDVRVMSGQLSSGLPRQSQSTQSELVGTQGEIGRTGSSRAALLHPMSEDQTLGGFLATRTTVPILHTGDSSEINEGKTTSTDQGREESSQGRSHSQPAGLGQRDQSQDGLRGLQSHVPQGSVPSSALGSSAGVRETGERFHVRSQGAEAEGNRGDQEVRTGLLSVSHKKKLGERADSSPWSLDGDSQGRQAKKEGSANPSERMGGANGNRFQGESSDLEWDLSKVAKGPEGTPGQDRQVPAENSGWNIIKGTRDADSTIWNEDGPPTTPFDHWPYIANPETRTIHIGNPGSHHADLHDEFQADGYQGIVYPWKGELNTRLYTPDDLEPQDRQTIHQTLEGHFGQPINNEDDGWKFGAFEDQRVPGIPHWVNGGHGQGEWEEGYETLPWTEGQYGKGFTMNGDVHTWAVDHGDPYSGEPHHEEVLNTLGHSWDSSFTPFQIDPQGNVTHLMSDRLHPESRELIESIPKLNVNDEESHEDSDWHFSGAAVEPWELGHNGKGVFLKDGTPAIWKVDQGGYPMHEHDGTPGWDECENGWNNSFHVDQFGKAGFWFPENIQKHHGPALAEKGIELDNGQKAGWVFGKTATTVVKHEGDPWFDGKDLTASMIYDPDADEVHYATGDNIYHRDIDTGNPNNEYGFIDYDHNALHWYHGEPMDEAKARGALSEHLGIPLQKAVETEDGWKFGATYTPWKPGVGGKATLIGDQLHAWEVGNEPHNRGYPTHSQMMTQHGWGFGDGDFHIGPNGELECVGTWGSNSAQEAIAKALKADPRLRAADIPGDWTFSKVAGEFPLNVEWMGSAADYAADHSLMIHPQQRRMVIGAPEFHHSDLIERYGQDGWMTGAIYDGELHTHDDPHNPLWDSVELYANRMNDMFGYPPVTRNKDEWKFSKTASKLDWLESRPDKFMQTDTGRQLFQILKVKFWNEKTDPLFPWLWREARKGRLSVVDRENLAILNDDGGIAGYLSAGRLNHWADWYADKRNPTRRGVDLMQLSAGDMVHKINEWEQHNADRDVAERLDGGKVLKTLANGWTVRELEPADLEFEGNEMGHCVGGEGYRRAVENGHTKIISLRDPQGHPHATMELETNMRVRPGEPGRYVIEQVQGKSNEIPKPEYQAMLKDWITGLPEGDRPSWKNEVEDISDLNEIVNPEDDDDPHGWGGYAPHGDYGIPLPPRQTDYDSVISDLHRLNDTWQGYGHYDPSHGEALYNHAVQRNEIPQLAKAFEGYQEKAMEDMQDMEDNNMDWLQYPGEYEDQPEFWDKIGQEDGISGRDAHEQAYENYSEARSELAENVPSYQAANHMGDLLSHHWDTDTGAFVNKPGVFSSWNFG